EINRFIGCLGKQDKAQFESACEARADSCSVWEWCSRLRTDHNGREETRQGRGRGRGQESQPARAGGPLRAVRSHGFAGDEPLAGREVDSKFNTGTSARGGA